MGLLELSGSWHCVDTQHSHVFFQSGHAYVSSLQCVGWREPPKKTTAEDDTELAAAAATAT